jgi:hypothetical protein
VLYRVGGAVIMARRRCYSRPATVLSKGRRPFFNGRSALLHGAAGLATKAAGFATGQGRPTLLPAMVAAFATWATRPCYMGR